MLRDLHFPVFVTVFSTFLRSDVEKTSKHPISNLAEVVRDVKTGGTTGGLEVIT